MHPESEKLYIEQIDLGEPEGKIRTIGSGLQPYVTLDEMLDGKIVVFANLKPKKLGGVPSEGMVLCASNEEHTVVELIRPPADAKIGDRIGFEDSKLIPHFSQDACAVLNPKRKVEGKVLQHLKTNGDKELIYNGQKLVTSDGKYLHSKSLANVSVS